MTAIADHIFEPRLIMGAPSCLGGSRMIVRMAKRMGAVSLTLVAMFVWLAPGAGWETDMLLFKLVVSVCAGLGAAALWQSSLPRLPPSVEIDMAEAELRLVREHTCGKNEVIERCRFVDLLQVDLSGRHIIFWGQGERMLAEITLSNAAAHATLLGALRKAGKLA